MTDNDVKRIGLLVGREWSWPPAFIEEVNRRDEGVVAEYIKLGGTKEDERCEYNLIVDRISHEVPYYRAYLKNAVLQGTVVINNPFMSSADDKFFQASLAAKLGVATPRTLLLPNKSYVPDISSESLRNLEYPLDWKGILDYVGLPAILKDAHGNGDRRVYMIQNINQLLFHYDQSGRLQMILQEHIEWDHYVRCLCINQTEILPLKYDPKERRYHVEHQHLTPELGARVVSDAQKLCQALGYDMNAVEFAIRDGIPYAVDFMNPVPDMDIFSLTPFYFKWAVEKMADMCIQKANCPIDPRREYRWYRHLPHHLHRRVEPSHRQLVD
ncbi:MAG: ATP-grasp domain-containing protein [Ardenticatenaceae bacterium]